MAAASWFNWAPTGPYSSPFFPSSIQQSPVLPQNHKFLQDYRVNHPRADPFRGYTDEGIKSKFSKYSDIAPGRFLYEEPSDDFGQSPVLPGSQSVVGENDELRYIGKGDPFAGSSRTYFPPKNNQKERFTAWLPSNQRPKTNQNSNGNPLLRVFPLLASGLITGFGGQTPLRGDQSPEGPDPDRDLGGAPPLRTLYHWKLIDFEFSTERDRAEMVRSGQFIPENTLPLGLEVYKERVFVTFPRWKVGVPCTLATAPRAPLSHVQEPRLTPFPDWSWHEQQNDDCQGLTSVFRVTADRCGRLWVLDSGQVEALTIPRQVCPPQVLAFDLKTDSLIGRWNIPDDFNLQNSLFTNIVTDIRDDKCDDVHVYFTDVWRFGLLVFRLRDEKFWRFSSHFFYPDPIASDYNVRGINFQWSDGVFGIALTPITRTGDKILYFHPMSSNREFQIPASILRNETAANDTALLAKVIQLAGESRGYSGHSSASAIDRNGVMFYAMVTRDSLSCWDTRKPYRRSTQGVVAKDSEKLIFPNDLKVDNEDKQSVWVLSNKLPVFLYGQLDPNDINFRILREYVEEAVLGSICDPRHPYLGDFEPITECY